MKTCFSWEQARSLLERWGWVEDILKAGSWSLGGHGKAIILVPTIEDLECRDEYDNFVSCLAGIYRLNPHALESFLEVEQCQ